MRGLTENTQGRSVDSGAVRCGRNGEADLRRPEEEDDGEGVTAGLPASLGAVRGRSGSRRFFWTAQGRDATAVGAVVVSGVDGSVRLRKGERAEGRRGCREREGRSGGCRGFTRASRGKRQAGGGRDACRRAAATHPRAHWHEVEDDWHMGLVGWLLCWAR